MQLATVSGLVQKNKSDATAPFDTQDYLVGVKVPFGAHALLASYIRHKNKAIANADTDRLAFGYTYALSKRTTLYTSASRVSNDAVQTCGQLDSPAAA
jgi:predicted porin